MTEATGATSILIEATINGELVTRRVEARTHLADFLRGELELTGTHLGCEHGVCGACTVLINGRSSRSCLTLAAQAHGKQIETVEGLTEKGKLDALRAAFIAHNAAQCAFCSSGMLITAYELLQSGQVMTREEIRTYLSGNICRCTGYQAIIDAVETVMHAKAGGV
jgi:carbon-monoxide dehydrogenase small subunit